MISAKQLLLVGALVAAVAISAFGLLRETPEKVGFAAQADRRDFTLIDADGKAATLATFHGKWLMVYFGFTHCPDICPTSLQIVAETLASMGERAKDIQPVFVTVDPERDTPQVLKDYLTNFTGNIVGLTGAPQQVADMTRRYGTFFRKLPTANGSYTMDHSSGFQFVSPAGVYVRAFRSDIAADELAPQIEATMKQGKD